MVSVAQSECHAAEEGEADAFLHDEKKVKKFISIIVSPKDCSNCHEKEVKQNAESHHVKAGAILQSLDNLLAEVVEGNSDMITEGFPNGVSAAAVNGCWQCHGSKVKVLSDGRLDPATWPNTGIGRFNPMVQKVHVQLVTLVICSRLNKRESLEPVVNVIWDLITLKKKSMRNLSTVFSLRHMSKK